MKNRTVLNILLVLTILASFVTMAFIPPPSANCSPGFWKNHTEIWPAQVDNMYDANMTWLQALQGGRETIVSRQWVAGQLNTIYFWVQCDED